MAQFLNYLEGTDTTTITPGNSGGASSHAFDAVTPAPAYTASAPAHGNTCATVTTTSGQVQYTRWNHAGEAVAAVRTYFKLPAAITTDVYVASLLDNASAQMAAIRVVSTGVLRLMGPSSTSVYTTSQQVPVNSWVRAELYVNQTTNQYRLAMYAGDSTTAIADSGLVTGTAGVVGTTGFWQSRFGATNSAATTGTVVYWDDVATNTGADATGLIGPYVAPAVASPPTAAFSQQALTEVNVSSTTSGATTTLTQVSGPSVAISGPISSIFRVTYTLPLSAPVVLTLTATNTAGSSTATVTIPGSPAGRNKRIRVNGTYT